jgi:probable HAF family extracellular repeat protein
MTNLRNAFCFSLLLLASVPLALAQGTYTQIDYPGATVTECWGIDTAGDITGSYTDTAGNWHGFFLSSGVFSTVDYPGAEGTYLFGINDLGQIVGSAGTGIGFLYDIQTQGFTTIAYPKAIYNFPTAINNAGTIAGYFRHVQDYEGFELIGSTYSRILPPKATMTVVNGIATSGELVGNGIMPPNSSAFNFVFGQGKYRLVTIPDAPAAVLVGINPAGTALVGSYDPAPTTSAAFVYQERTLVTLEFPSAIGTGANGVNDAGVVVGSFLDANDVYHGFTWTPPAAASEKK